MTTNPLEIIAAKYAKAEQPPEAEGPSRPAPSEELAELGELLRRNRIGLRRRGRGLVFVYHDRAAVSPEDQVEILALVNACYGEIRANHWTSLEPDADEVGAGPSDVLDPAGATSREVFARGNPGKLCTLHTATAPACESSVNPNG